MPAALTFLPRMPNTLPSCRDGGGAPWQGDGALAPLRSEGGI